MTKQLTNSAVQEAAETVADGMAFEDLAKVVHGDAAACEAHDAAVKALLSEQGYNTADFEMR